MKKFTKGILICILCIIISLISALLIIIQITWGYGGFKTINGKNSLIALSQGCQQQYFLTTYKQPLENHLQVCLVFAFISFIASLSVAILTICFMHFCKQENNQIDETRILENQLHHRNQENLQRYYPKLSHIVILYILLFLIIITSAVSFHFYLAIAVESQKSTCQINYEKGKMITFIVLSGIMLALALTSFIILLILTYGYHKRMDMIEIQNGSESYRQKVNRIMRGIPDSQRRFHEHQELKKYLKDNQYEVKQEVVKEKNHYTHPIDMNEVPQVKSILYKPGRELMLESIHKH